MCALCERQPATRQLFVSALDTGRGNKQTQHTQQKRVTANQTRAPHLFCGSLESTNSAIATSVAFDATVFAIAEFGNPANLTILFPASSDL